MRGIREKAKQAEQTVQFITKDIKSLDMAKRNLTSAITVLKRLQMLCTLAISLSLYLLCSYFLFFIVVSI